MKKILTAINNPKLNEELKKEKNFEVIGKDIQYKEAIIEVLEKNDSIDLVIINEKIPGEMEIEKLIERIKLKNDKIKIIFILEKENNELEKILIKNNIVDIYYNNKINLKELINIINKKEINMEEEIIKLKKIIEQKNISDNQENKSKKRYKKDKSKNRKEKNIKSKIITISGNYKSGKSTLTLIISEFLIKKNKKVLIIDADLEKQDLSIILQQEKNNKVLKNKFENQKKDIDNYEIEKKINLVKISKNLFLLNKLNYLFKNKTKEEIKKIISEFLEIEKQKYNFIIIDLAKNNSKVINQNIIEKSNLNFVVMEPNLLGVREIKKLIDIYLKEWKIEKEKIYMIANRKNNSSINKEIILKVLFLKNKIYEIKENKNYSILINNYFNKIILLKNKIIKKEINKIIYAIIKD